MAAMQDIFDEKEAQVYAFICKHIDQFTRPPTIREIAQACYMSRANAVRYLDKLDAHGHIIREANKARGIRLPGRDTRL